jgi:ribosome-associated toxin RatA of RatAB toxin-antitoxin module
VHADATALFELAARVEDWPRILPHYRYVNVLGHAGDARLVEMAARREVMPGVAVPLWWRSLQSIDREARRIRFEHVAGITRGMWVEWAIAPGARGGVDVRIVHTFEPRWPVPDALIGLVVGDYFVNGVAQRTLACLERKAR